MSWVEKTYFVKLPSGLPTQGDIWSNLPHSFSDPPCCTGIVITPRCDLGHNKAPVINYLAILPLSEFMLLYGGFRLIEQEIHRNREALKNVANSLNVVDLLDIGFTPDQILQTVLAVPQAQPESKTQTRIAQQINDFNRCNQKIQQLQQLLEQPKLTNDNLIASVTEKAMNKYKLDIVRNTVSDLHFLPPCPPLLGEPSVVLLRYVVTSSVELFKAASECLNQHQWESICQTRSSPDFALAPEKPERLLRLKSPFFESLMGRFAAMFGRVGVRDFDQNQLDAFVRAKE